MLTVGSARSVLFVCVSDGPGRTLHGRSRCASSPDLVCRTSVRAFYLRTQASWSFFELATCTPWEILVELVSGFSPWTEAAHSCCGVRDAQQLFFSFSGAPSAPPLHTISKTVCSVVVCLGSCDCFSKRRACWSAGCHSVAEI